ncbi:MAG: helix-turn-helix domain-containing protein [Thermodesulfobacteriota bacterium]|nr:helix-turn-helix domain-containing protein [Thermodesulfobacteriota bacterium]
MGKIENIVKSEIVRLAKREVRAAFFPLRREVHRMRLNLSRLSKNFISLDRLAKEQVRQGDSKKLKMETNLEQAKAARFTPERIRLLRKKLGISQKDLAVLAGVSMGAVASWEKGKFHPKLEKKATLVAIRKLRKRDVKKILTSKVEEAEKQKPPKRKTKANR